MRYIFLPAACLITLLLLSSNISAQDNADKQAKYRIKIVKNENGKETIIDKTFDTEAELKAFTKSLGEDNPAEERSYKNIKKSEHYVTPPTPPTPPTTPQAPDAPTAPAAPEMAEMPNIEIITIEEDGGKAVKKITLRENKQIVTCEPGKNGKATITIQDENGKKMVIRKKIDEDFEDLEELDEIESIEGPINVETTITRDEKGRKVIIKKITIEDSKATEAPGEMRIEKEITRPGEKGEGNMNGLKFYPNPSQGNLHVAFNIEKATDVKVTITDMEGKEVFTENLKNFSGNYDKDITGANLAKGQYLLRVTAGGNTGVLKILVQ